MTELVAPPGDKAESLQQGFVFSECLFGLVDSRVTTDPVVHDDSSHFWEYIARQLKWHIENSLYKTLSPWRSLRIGVCFAYRTGEWRIVSHMTGEPSDWIEDYEEYEFVALYGKLL